MSFSPLSVKQHIPFLRPDKETFVVEGAVAPEMVETREPNARVHRVIDVPWFPLILDTDKRHGAP